MFTPVKPSDAFEWVQAAGGPALVCRPLAAVARHVFTTRGWRLGERGTSGDAGWQDVAGAMQVDAGHLVRVRQVHGAAAIRAYGPATSPLSEADILVTEDPSIALAVQIADCVPLLIADRRTGAVAAVHAGWRGLAEGAPIAAIEQMRAQFSSRALELVAAIGPAIGPCCYEVGDEVRERVAARFLADVDRWFRPDPARSARNPSMAQVSGGRAHRWFFDCWRAARDQLRDAGVPVRQIHVAALCTASHPDVFCSYRRDGHAAGRMAAAIRRGMRRPSPR